MKILIIIDQFLSGGGARVVSRLLDGFVYSKHEVLLATRPFEGKNHYSIPNEVRVLDFSPKSRIDIPFLRTLSILLSGIMCCKHLINEHKPDVIIAEMAGSFFLSYFGALGTKTPIVAHDHTSFLRKLNVFYNFIRFYFYKNADALVILTERDRNVLGSKFPNKRVIYNPLPFEPLDVYTIEHRRNSILCVGRFDAWYVKGFDIILKIFKVLSQKHQEWKLEFAGTGSEESINYIKSIILQYNIQDKVVFWGQVSDIKLLYQGVKIFALPSRVEGLPMGLMEAMSQGCACVAFEVGGATTEMIQNEKSGFCIKDGDEKAFHYCLEKLILNDELVCSMGTASIYESYKFSLSIINTKWNDLFKSIIQEK